LKIESSSRSSNLQSSKIDELAEKIEVLENKEKELESENEKLRMGFQDVIFENSIAHALLMQNVRSVQDRVKTRRIFFWNGAKNALFFSCPAFLNLQKHPK
jgi:flagellar motility protein MotE (MotC chaperone)